MCRRLGCNADQFVTIFLTLMALLIRRKACFHIWSHNTQLAPTRRERLRFPEKMETPLSEDQWHVLRIVQNDKSLERRETRKHHFLKTHGVFYFAERQDVSVQRPERWKHEFLKTNGMFYLAEKQEPRAPRKMETPLSEDQWRVLLCRTTRASSAQTDGNANF